MAASPVQFAEVFMYELDGPRPLTNGRGDAAKWWRTSSGKLLPVRAAVLSCRFEQYWHIADNSPPI
ncbi:MAG: hypothetical protein ABIO92_09030 [Chloroflexia bacterium]